MFFAFSRFIPQSLRTMMKRAKFELLTLGYQRERRKDYSKEEVRKLTDSMEDAHLQILKMNWEKEVEDLTDATNEYLHGEMADIINVNCN